jgi:hypothetical protein
MLSSDTRGGRKSLRLWKTADLSVELISVARDDWQVPWPSEPVPSSAKLGQ